MAQWVKVLPPAFDLGTHMVEGKNALSASCPLTTKCMPWHMHSVTQYISKQTNECSKNFKSMLPTIAKLFPSSYFEQNMLDTRTLQGWRRWTEVKRQDLQSQREGASLQGTAEGSWSEGEGQKAMAEAHRRAAALLLGPGTPWNARHSERLSSSSRQQHQQGAKCTHSGGGWPASRPSEQRRPWQRHGSRESFSGPIKANCVLGHFWGWWWLWRLNYGAGECTT